MWVHKEIKDYLSTIEQTEAYLVEKAKLDLSLQIEALRKINNFSYKEIANRLKTSAAYVTKLLRGDSNVTIETMVKLSKALNGTLEIKLKSNLPSQLTIVEFDDISTRGEAQSSWGECYIIYKNTKSVIAVNSTARAGEELAANDQNAWIKAA